MKDSETMKLIKLLLEENPKAVLAVCMCLLISSILEGVGISSIFPIITIILEIDAELPDSKLTEIVIHMKSWGVYALSTIVVLCFVLKSCVMHVIYVIISSNIAGFSHNLRKEFVHSMLNGKIDYIQSKSLGESLSVLTNDSIRAAAAYISATRVLAGVFQVILYVCFALWLSITATVASFLTMVVLVLLVKGTMRKTRLAGAETTQFIHKISQNMGEAMRGIKAAKATANEKYLNKLIIEGSDDLRRAHATNIVVGQVLRNIQDPVLIASALFCLVLFKDYLSLEPGYILFIMAVYYRLMTSLNLVQSDYQKFLGQEKSLWKIKSNILTAQNQIELTKKDGVVAQNKPEKIFFDQVSIAFDEKKVLNSVSFNIAPNKLTLLRGESGKGKTTTIDMICSLVQPDTGEIRVGHTPLNEINTESWRKTLGYVDQFPFLFKASIKDNIVLNCDDVSEEDIRRVIKLCHLKKFIESQEYGLDFVLNEGGSNISGGQRQRIAIARAVVRKPCYLILDEPTSALDHESEEVIFQTLKELSNTMSVIVVSHSKDLEKYADDVINFDRF